MSCGRCGHSYTLSVARLCLLLALAVLGWPQAPQVEEPPEEDLASAPKEYAFNPLQAAKELRVGEYYFRKGSYKAAARRFEEALKWNPGFAEAYYRLGESRWKLGDLKGACEALNKYLELEPQGKFAKSARKRLEEAAKRPSQSSSPSS